MILSQLVDSKELRELTPDGLRALILKLDDEIRFGVSSGEKLLVSIEANIVGVDSDRPAGSDIGFQRTIAAANARPAKKA